MIAVDYARASATAVQIWLGVSLFFSICLCMFMAEGSGRPHRPVRQSSPRRVPSLPPARGDCHHHNDEPKDAA